ncbi:hypothetical protein BCR41DRAFT_392528 [Lobosporangium transversale]|uniref:Uncharacterized protein n=1 Tax=Lobosporangium transversale TaxID=64571 RepID=A0A1Y2H2A9_9FUNG|nr:hypothetical protein BCR41DRAFT_392528 [Lobosporangium transversale]ORZ27192.1 hypothetical protein BCR41DRAFT_392528 [Lobosporangium transversale]|eukprot:XP_021884919.1 hypothetical protein BCR41DRAFT_392528 [Lobosporangium transversale]
MYLAERVRDGFSVKYNTAPRTQQEQVQNTIDINDHLGQPREGFLSPSLLRQLEKINVSKCCFARINNGTSLKVIVDPLCGKRSFEKDVTEVVGWMIVWHPTPLATNCNPLILWAS